MSTEAPSVPLPEGAPPPRPATTAGAARRLPRLPVWFGILPFVVYVVIFLGAPLYEVISGAFTGSLGGTSFSNFSTTFSHSNSQYLNSFKGSLILAAWTSAAGAVFGTWLAYAVVVSKPNSPLRRIVQTGSGVLAYFAGVPLAFAMIAALGKPGAGVVTDILDSIGIHLYNHNFNIVSILGLGLCYVYFQVPLMVILITPALEGLKNEWREAAAGLGATSWRYWRLIGAPVLAPPFISSFLLLFGNAFAAYATALALLNGSVNLVPSQIAFALSGNVLVNQTGIGLALGVEMIVVVAVLMIIYSLVIRRASRWSEA